MSRGRFGLLLGLLVVVVTTASFLGVLSLLGDDDPSGGASPSTTTSSSTSSSTTTTVPGELVTPTFVAVVSSEGDEPAAQQRRDDLTEAGYDAGVLHSDEYSSLEAGFWVAYVGPFPDAAGAQAAVNELVADGYSAAYARCVGTDDQCR